jgi:hypothetical protein
MPIVDAHGRPVASQTDRLMPILIKDMKNLADAINFLRHASMMGELKINFLLTKLNDKGLLGADIDTEWRIYAETEMAAMKQAAEDAGKSVLDNSLEVEESEQPTSEQVEVKI